MAERNLQAEMEEWQERQRLEKEMAEFRASQQQEKPDSKFSLGSVKGAIEDWRDLSEGIGVSALETYYGAKDLLGLGNENDRAVLKRWKDAAGRSGWGTAGEVVGDVAQYAVPGSAGLKGAKALNAANKARLAAKALPTAADVAGSAAIAYTKLPEEGQTREENAAQEAGMALGGAALGKTLKVIGAGTDMHPAAERLRDKGVKMTIGQAHPHLKRLEDMMEVTPGAARAIKGMKRQANTTWHKAALQEAAPLTASTVKEMDPTKLTRFKVTEAGHEGVRQLKKAYDEAYDEAYGSISKLRLRHIGDILDAGNRGSDILTKTQRAKVKRLREDILHLWRNNKDGSAKLISERIKNEMMGTPKARNLDSVLDDMLSRLKAGLPEENQLALQRVDADYGKYVAVREAAGSATARKSANVFHRAEGEFDPAGMFGIEDLVGGSGRASNRYDRGLGNAPMQDFINDSMQTVGQEMGPTPLSWWRRMSDFFPTIGPQRTFGEVVAGNKAYQSTGRRLVRSRAAQEARKYASPARLSAALYDEDEE